MRSGVKIKPAQDFGSGITQSKPVKACYTNIIVPQLR